jgi:hypothetical protein
MKLQHVLLKLMVLAAGAPSALSDLENDRPRRSFSQQRKERRGAIRQAED